MRRLNYICQSAKQTVLRPAQVSASGMRKQCISVQHPPMPLSHFRFRFRQNVVVSLVAIPPINVEAADPAHRFCIRIPDLKCFYLGFTGPPANSPTVLNTGPEIIHQLRIWPRCFLLILSRAFFIWKSIKIKMQLQVLHSPSFTFYFILLSIPSFRLRATPSSPPQPPRNFRRVKN